MKLIVSLQAFIQEMDVFSYRYQALREIAIDWLESRGIAYQE